MNLNDFQMTQLRLILTAALINCLTLLVNGQLQITPGVPAASLGSSAFGNGITIVGDPIINCNTNQYGVFSNGMATSLGFNNGLIMSTGTATLAAGPASSFASGSYNVSVTDPQLTAIAAGATNDVCIITITLVPQCNTLALRFVFGSEEYPEFVGGNFNDVFGFFVSGPNPAGGTYNNFNIAQLPNGTPVSINNVNPNLNNTFYVDNASSTTIAYDGLTTVLTPVLDVIACQEYTFKLAIADAGDFSYDSAIFIDFISCATSVAAVDPVITPTTCGDASGGVDVSIVNGIGPFITSWVGIPGNFTDHITNVPAGNYTISIFDTGMPCATASNFTFTVPNNGVPAATNITSPDNIICLGESVTLNASGADSFIWTDSFGQELSTTSSLNNAINESQYIYAEGSTICSADVDSIFVQVNPTPIPSPTASASNCVGDDVQLNANLSIPGVTTWIGPNNYFSSALNPILTNVNLNTSGVYYVTASADGCFSSLVPVNVTITPTPVANPTTAGIVCAGQSLLLIGNAGMDGYQWSGPNGFSSTFETPEIPDASFSDQGDYTLIVTDNGCESAPASVQAQITSNPTVEALPVIPICDGENVLLGANSISIATYQWTGPNGFTSTEQNPVITNANLLANGTYSVVATAASCPSSAATVDVVVNSIPMVTASSSITNGCEGTNFQLFATDYVGADYAWFGPDGFISTNQNPVINNSSTLASGSYSVTIVANNCDSPISTTDVTIYPIPSFSLSSNSPLCAGDDLILTSTSVVNGDYAWTGPQTFASSQEDPTINGVNSLSSGDYSLVVSANGCISPAQTIAVVVNPIPIANPINSGPVCVGSTLQLSTNTSNGMTYEWQGPNGFSSSAASPIISSAQLNNSGDYQLIVIQNGCTSQVSSTTVIIWQNPTVMASVSQDSICYGQSTQLSVSGVVQAVWQPGPIQSLNTTVSPISNTIYSVVGIDANGCSGSAQVEVSVTQPLIMASATPESVNVPGSVEGYLPLPVEFSVNTNCTSFVWEFGDNSPTETGNNAGVTFNHEYQTENIYFATVTGQLNGCEITDTIMVNAYGVAAIGCPEGFVECAELEIPNIITPNGDAFNDYFWVPNVHLKELDIQIFNRWGTKVGAISDPNHYWDIPKAHWKGDDHESGVYFYTIQAIGKDGVHFNRQGTFQLVK